MRRTRQLRIGASNVAANAMNGAIRATGEIRGEATGFVRDTVMGVFGSAGQVAKIGTPVIRDVVAAAVRTSTERGGSMYEASQDAVESAIVGAASVGADTEIASAQASAGVVQAVRQMGGNFQDVVAPAMHGVVIGVTATNGDLLAATRDTASSLLTSTLQSGEDATEVARIIVNEAIRASKLYTNGTSAAVMGATQGCVEAAYAHDDRVGDMVRLAIMSVVEAPVTELAPTIRDSVKVALGELSGELRNRPQAWRGVAMWRAAKSIIKINGLDIGAALAYYLLLALFPLVALVIVGLSWFVDPSVIRTTITEVVVFYFPSSKDYLEEAIIHLFGARLVASVIAVVAMLFGAHGLFMAANRGVSAVFGTEPRRMIDLTLSTFAIVLLAVSLFLVSVTLTIVLQVGVRVIGDIPTIGITLNQVAALGGRVASILTPFTIAAIVFIVVYKNLPNTYVRWSNAAFGGFVTVILFEMAKYGFFWFAANIASQRNVLYGSLSSVILLLIWSHVAGVIFLYGAALTKEASELRPQESPISLRAHSQEMDRVMVMEEERRRENIARGRAPSHSYRYPETRRDPYPRRRRTM